jgi:ubiquinone/menaquinone biosynthesis C-methylase UbiE
VNGTDVQNAYNEWSATYDADRNLTRDLDREVAAIVLGTMRFRSILEIGCGTGKNTQLLSQIGEKVLAVDFSQGMLDQARAAVTSSNVTFSLADITRRWPGDDGAFDLAACNLVLEHIADLGFVFSEASRALTKGGQLFVCELHPFRQYLGTRAEYKGTNGATQIQAFVHHISDFLQAADQNGLALDTMREWWHPEDTGKPPRLVSFMFKKR